MGYELKEKILNKLKEFHNGSIAENSIQLLNILGYSSNKTFEMNKESFGDELNDKNRKRALFSNWKSASFLFQLSSDETGFDKSLFEGKRYQKNLYQSYVFIAVELEKGNYS